MTKTDRKFMQAAIRQAGQCQPEDQRTHPKVGVVVVKDGKILAAAHRGEQEPGDHAEFTALEKKLAGRRLTGATVYTTLEPCTTRNHPKVPCVDRLIERKVSRVVIGMFDPDQRICGRSFRRLRKANIVTDVFPSDLMAQVEEQNREFIREKEEAHLKSIVGLPLNDVQPTPSTHGKTRVPVDRKSCADMIAAAGLTAFFPSREYYPRHREGAASISRYVSTARKSIALVSVNLMTGLPFEGLCEALEKKLERKRPVSAVISLLDPWQKNLMSTMAPVLELGSRSLADSIKGSLKRLVEFRHSLSKAAQCQLEIRVHKSIPFGSAILIDHERPFGRIQIETKPYKAPLCNSFAFEVAPGAEGALFEALVGGYQALLGDGEAVREDLLT